MPTSIATDFINFSRGSLATVTDSDGKIKWAGHNLFPSSESFDASFWYKNGVTVSPNTTTSPDGTITADAVFENSNNGYHIISVLDRTFVTGTHTLAIFIKANGRTKFVLGTNNTAIFAVNSVFDLTTVTATSTFGTAAIVSAGNGWYMLSVTGEATSGVCNLNFVLLDDASGSVYAGDITKGIYLWGAHLYRSDLGGMQANQSAYPMYYPTTVKNLSKYTEEWGTGNWSNLNTSSTPNATTAPNGLQTADLIYPSSSGSLRQAYHSVNSGTSGTRVVISLYLKSAGQQWIGIVAPNGANYGCYFDIINGVKGTESAGITGTITPVGSGWYRCSVSEILSGSVIYGGISFADVNGGTTVTASGTSGVYAWGIQFSDSASLDPYVPVYGAAQTSAAYYAPRIDYDPVTLAAKGLLVEYQRTNLILRSHEFDNATWSTTGTTVVTSSVAAPSGTLTADDWKLNSGISITTSALGLFTSGITARLNITSAISLSAAPYTYSLYVKAGSGLTHIQLRVGTDIYLTGTNQYGTIVRLSDGYVVAGDVGTTTNVTNTGGGWYRVAFTFTPSAASYYLGVWAWNDTSKTSNGTEFISLWGAQLENGSYATSYIPTSSTTVTRNTDLGQVFVGAMPYNSNEYTLIIEVQRYAAEVAGMDEGTGVEFSTGAFQTNIVQLMYDYGSFNSPAARIFSSAGSLIFIPRGTGNSPNFVVGEAPKKIGLALKSGNSAIGMSGVVSTTYSNTFTIPQTTRLKFSTASDGAQGSDFMGWIRNVSYIPKRLSNAELQKRTS